MASTVFILGNFANDDPFHLEIAAKGSQKESLQTIGRDLLNEDLVAAATVNMQVIEDTFYLDLDIGGVQVRLAIKSDTERLAGAAKIEHYHH